MLARLAVLVLVLLAAPALPCERGTVTGRVTYVRDGDTIELGPMAIRLQGLAAPERESRAVSRRVRRWSSWYRARGCAASSTAPGRKIDASAPATWRAGTFAAAMVREGLARDCPRFSGGRYARAERSAAAEGATIAQSYVLPGYCRPR